MGSGIGKGPNRIDDALKGAFESPLLNDFDLKSAKNVLVNITVGKTEQGLTMKELQEINNKIDEYTGGANKFKSGIIWEEGDGIEDRIQITTIVTGLNFSNILGERERELDNYIVIDKNFIYDKEELSKSEGISLPSDAGSHIGFSSKDGERTFRYDPDNRPALLISEGQSISDLEKTPAIRRSIKKEHKSA
jgi:cell division protein FtsZ